MRRLEATEDQLQAALVEWLDLQRRLPGGLLPVWAMIHHSPNEGKRGPKARRLVRSLGVRAGFPDLVIIAYGSALFLELKSAKGRLTHDQAICIRNLHLCGFDAFVVRALEDAQAIVAEWATAARESWEFTLDADQV